MRVAQPIGARGSLKWLQRVAGGAAPEVEQEILGRLPATTRLEWLSPREDDAWAEYRDGAFLDRIGHSALGPALQAFWPRQGPQWDGLARSDAGHVILVEAKAHIGELRSGGCQASPASRSRIETSLRATALACGATRPEAWTGPFYQLANRLAHLHFLRQHGVDAVLVLMSFLHDAEMGGPANAEDWYAAYSTVDAAMGLVSPHALTPHVLHVHPDVGRLIG